jgi:hypothetical protein
LTVRGTVIRIDVGNNFIQCLRVAHLFVNSSAIQHTNYLEHEIGIKLRMSLKSQNRLLGQIESGEGAVMIAT